MPTEDAISSHLTLDKLQEWLLAYPGLEEELLPHLGACCGECAAVLAELAEYRRRFRHWDAAVVLSEGRVAPSLYRRLLDEGGGDAATLMYLVTECEDFQTWGVAVLILEEAEAALCQKNPLKARSMAFLALPIAKRLGACYHLDWISDLEAWAHCLVTAASFDLGDTAGVAKWFPEAQRALRAGTGQPTILLDQIFAPGSEMLSVLQSDAERP